MNSAQIKIVDFHPRYGDAFKTLNVEWLAALFEVEPIDDQVLSNPKSTIADGGAILYALNNDEAIGCCALKHRGDGVYELTKMAVTAAAQGLGIGRLLGEAAVARYHELGGSTLYLETHDSLTPAITLYETLGFSHAKSPFKSPYARSNVYMKYTSSD